MSSSPFSLLLSLPPTTHPSSPSLPAPMATASTSWMPAGRHDVRVGSSLSKALKARKGQPPTQRSKALPERDFYALRCARRSLSLLPFVRPLAHCLADNHKPASIDSTKPGTLEVNPGREVTTVRVERPTVNVRFPPHVLATCNTLMV
jgi:hypothetical protein